MLLESCGAQEFFDRLLCRRTLLLKSSSCLHNGNPETYSELVAAVSASPDFDVAVREQDEQDFGEALGNRVRSLTVSPSSSTAAQVITGFSSARASSMHRGVLCTPFRIFFEH